MSDQENIRKLLDPKGNKKEETDIIINMLKEDDRAELWKGVRSWLSVLISLSALVVSILALIKIKAFTN